MAQRRGAGCIGADVVELDAVRDIVERLDAIPLALELAAGLSGVLSPRELRDRLSPSLPMLGRRSTEGRHATMRAAVQHSWDLLDPAARIALAQASLFRGGFGLDEAEAVLTCDEPVPLVLESLRERSLLVSEATSEGIRFRVLECIREFGEENVDPLAPDARMRHAVHFVTAGERRSSDIEGSDHRSAMAWLVREQDNLVAAHRWALEANPELAARVALVVDRALHLRGPYALRFAVLKAAVYAIGDDESELAVRIAIARGVARLDAGRYDDTIADLERAHAAALRDGRRDLATTATFQMGNVAPWRAKWTRAEPTFREALAESETIEDVVRFKALTNLAMIVSGAGRVDEARELYTRALQTDPTRTYLCAKLAPNLASLHHQEGELDRARVTLREAIEELERQGDRYYLCFAHINLAWVEIEARGRLAAERSVGTALELAAKVGDLRLRGLAWATEGVLRAEHGDIASAREAFRESRVALDEVHDTNCDDIYGILEGFVDVARSRSDPTRADLHRALARRVSSASRRGTCGSPSCGYRCGSCAPRSRRRRRDGAPRDRRRLVSPPRRSCRSPPAARGAAPLRCARRASARGARGRDGPRRDP